LNQLNDSERINADTLYSKYFFCLNDNVNGDSIISNGYSTKNDSINDEYSTDQNVAWYGATGSAKPVQRLIWNVADNRFSCRCMTWPISEYYLQDNIFKSLVDAEFLKYPDNPSILDLKEKIEERKKKK